MNLCAQAQTRVGFCRSIIAYYTNRIGTAHGTPLEAYIAANLHGLTTSRFDCALGIDNGKGKNGDLLLRGVRYLSSDCKKPVPRTFAGYLVGAGLEYGADGDIKNFNWLTATLKGLYKGAGVFHIFHHQVGKTIPRCASSKDRAIDVAKFKSQYTGNKKTSGDGKIAGSFEEVLMILEHGYTHVAFMKDGYTRLIKPAAK